MSEAAQTAATAPDLSRVRADLTYLGMSPLRQCFLTILGVAVVGGLLTLMFAGAKGGAQIIALFIGLPSMLAVCYLGIRLIVLLLMAGGPGYAKTHRAISEGRIGVSYLLRDGLGYNFVVVDERRRLLAVNGDVFGFDDVKTVGYEVTDGRHPLEFTLRTGDDPIRVADLGTEDNLKRGYARLANTLGLT